MGNQYVRRYVTVAVLALCGVVTTDTHADEWTYEIIPFLWAASLDGREGLNGFTADVSASFSDLVEFVNVGASTRFTARRPPVAWFAEASYVELEDDVGTSIGTLRVRSAQTFRELGLSYELDSALALYGGIRFQQLDTRINIPARQFAIPRAGSTASSALVGPRFFPNTRSAGFVATSAAVARIWCGWPKRVSVIGGPSAGARTSRIACSIRTMNTADSSTTCARRVSCSASG
jgi:hypothetical protein